MTYTPKEIETLKAEGLTNQEIADSAGVSEATIRRWARKQPDVLRASYDKDAGTVTINGEVSDDEVSILIAESGLNPDDWIIVSTTLNRWEGPAAGGATKTYSQTKVTLKLKPALVLPKYAVPEALLEPPEPVRVSVHEPRRVIIEGDHHAPYQDARLDALLTRAHFDLRPDRQVFLGDLGDYPTISRHKDHPAAMASVNECIQGSFDILFLRRQAHRAAHADLLRGNHDWRIEAEILARAERLDGIAAADQGDGEREPLFSLRKALHLDALGITLHENPQGWEHDELVLVPGEQGLVVRHGFLHGVNTAKKTVEKRGMSVIVGHSHNRETAHVWDAYTRTHRQGLVLGVCCSTNKRFAHYAPENGWAQGAGFVEIWPDGRWVAEHIYYDDGVLTLRDKRWEV